MNCSPFLVLSGTFTFLGKHSFYITEFLNDGLVIKEGDISKDIKYTDIFKIKYSSTKMKIILQSGEIICIPCNSNDMKKIKTLFKTSENIQARDIKGSAFVSIGDYQFFVLINTTDLKELKIKILERIGKLMYPACESEGILLDKFKKFKFLVLIDKSRIELNTSEDLEAALIYCENKLSITIDSQ